LDGEFAQNLLQGGGVLLHSAASLRRAHRVFDQRQLLSLALQDGRFDLPATQIKTNGDIAPNLPFSRKNHFPPTT
jgi:hypothetical protein